MPRRSSPDDCYRLFTIPVVVLALSAWQRPVAALRPRRRSGCICSGCLNVHDHRTHHHDRDRGLLGAGALTAEANAAAAGDIPDNQVFLTSATPRGLLDSLSGGLAAARQRTERHVPGQEQPDPDRRPPAARRSRLLRSVRTSQRSSPRIHPSRRRAHAGRASGRTGIQGLLLDRERSQPGHEQAGDTRSRSLLPLEGRQRRSSISAPRKASTTSTRSG